MPEVRLGLEAVLIIDGVEFTNVKDLTVSLEKDEADASTRANNGWRATAGTLKDASIEFTGLNKYGDTALGLLQGLWTSGDPCDVGISDAGGREHNFPQHVSQLNRQSPSAQNHESDPHPTLLVLPFVSQTLVEGGPSYRLV